MTVVATPIFIAVGPGGIRLGESPRLIERAGTFEGVSLPLSFFLYPILALTWWLSTPRARQRWTGVSVPLTLVFCASAVVSFVVGTFNADRGNDAVRVAYLLQTLQPTLLLAVGFSVMKLGWAPSLLRAWARVVSAVALLHLALTAIYGRDEVIGFAYEMGVWQNSKALRFFPFAAGIAGTFLYSHYRQLNRSVWAPSKLIGWAPPILLVLLSHSRTALLGTVVALLALEVSGSRRRVVSNTNSPAGLHVTRMYGMIIVVCCAVALAFLLGAESVSRAFEVTSGLTGSDERRVTAVFSSLGDGLTNPFGNAFAAVVDVSTAGQSVDIARIAISENQFGEYSLRGGPLLSVTFIALLVAGARTRWRHRKGSTAQRIGLGIFTGFLVIGAFTQLSFTEAYVAPICWFILGVVLADDSMTPRRDDRTVAREVTMASAP